MRWGARDRYSPLLQCAWHIDFRPLRGRFFPHWTFRRFVVLRSASPTVIGRSLLRRHPLRNRLSPCLKRNRVDLQSAQSRIYLNPTRTWGYSKVSLSATGINNTNVLIGHFGMPTSLARVYSTIARVFCLHSFTGRYSIQKNKQLWVKAIHRPAFTSLHAPPLSSASRGAEDGRRRKQDALPHSTATNDRPSVKAVKAKNRQIV